MKNQIQLVLKDNIKDVLGEKVERNAVNFLNLYTGKIKTGKIFNITYDLNQEELSRFADLGLKDEIIHDVYLNSFYQNDFFKSFILIAKLPGVTDDEGVSAQKTLNDILGLDLDVNTQHIFTEDIYLIEKELPENDLQRLSEELLGNKLIHHFEFGKFTGKVDYLPEVKIKENIETEIIDLNVSDEELLKISKDRLLSLNLEEMKAIQKYFADEKVIRNRRKNGLSENPTDCELEVLAQTWSEHCKHKEFAATIHYKNLETGEEETIDSLFKTYIRKSTEIIRDRLKKAGNNWLLKIFTDNAGVVKINDESVFVWKVETHNSPSAIDPYGGAITGILGNNRDPLGTGIGGGKLLFNTNVLCFGPPNYDKKLLPGQLHPKRIFEGVRHGIEDGGNKSGIPTVNGSIIFDDRYSGKPLVYCGTGGVMPFKFAGVNSWEKPIEDGDLIIMAGGRVGKDGIHGATFSSAEIDEHSPQSAVQIGSPITQKLVSDFMQPAVERGLIKCSTDNGAGGLSSSVGELAEISGGALVNLENVPLKYSNLKPWEIFVSESQERMTFVVKKENKQELFNLAKEREVELTEIGKFTSTGFIDVRYNNEKVALLGMDFLHNGVPGKYLQAEWKKPQLSKPEIPENLDYNEILLKLMGSLNICSRENVIRQYDHEVKGKTIIKSLMGKDGKTPQDAAVMRLNFDSYEGIAISNGICPKYGDIDAYEMSAGAFDEAIRQIISIGGKLPDIKDNSNRFWTVNDNFCVPDSAFDAENNPDGKQKLAKLVQMNKALFEMSTFFNIPMTSGKDSMKNDFKAGKIKISVPPTILYSMVAKIDDVRKTVTSNFKAAGDLIYILGKTYNELGASEFYKFYDELGANVPKVRKENAKKLYKKVMIANEQNLIESCHDLSDGGLAVAVCESAIGTDFGAELDLTDFGDLSLNAILFSESHSRFVVSIKPGNKKLFEKIFGEDCKFIGKVNFDKVMEIIKNNDKVVDLEIEELEQAWDKRLE
ncbi:MAG TPA: phosphoribosylformylglycinamidine synthase [Candidatus Cloacimonetes bacterium]|nr:phosphoribosylformylglycinamidine synthase [Candidatus Cloacimonadota bacterium]